MQDYLRSVWAMLTPFREDSTPLLPSSHDLEAYGHGAPDTDNIVVVCDAPLPVCTRSHPGQFERVSPFSEYHFPVRPFVLASDA